EPVHHAQVEVVTTQVHITVCRLHFEYAVAEFEDGNIECTTAKVVDGDLHVFVLLVETVSERGRGRFVNDTLHIQPCDLTCFLRSLTFRVVEVCRYRDNGFGYSGTQIVFSGALHLLKDHRRNLLGRIETIANADTHGVIVTAFHLVRDHLHLVLDVVKLLTHKPLNRNDGIARVGDGLPLGRVPDFAFSLAVIQETHDGGGGSPPFAVGYHHRLIAFH